MGRIYIPPKVASDMYGRPVIVSKSSVEFAYLIGMRVSDIVLFTDSTVDLIESGATILPRHHSIFVGTKDGELQYKPYEYDANRIVVSTYKGVIVSIDSLG
jgi:hypothetical protein